MGDVNESLRILNDSESTFRIRVAAIMDIVRGTNQTAKQKLARWLFTRAAAAGERVERLVYVHALGLIGGTLNNHELRNLFVLASGLYESGDTKVGEQELLTAVVRNVSPAQRAMVIRELGNLLELQTFPTRRKTVLAELTWLVETSTEEEELRKIEAAVQERIDDEELANFKRNIETRETELIPPSS